MAFNRVARFIIIGFLIAFFFSASKVVGMYVDWLFFRETGLETMFTRVLSAEVLTGFAFGFVFFIFTAANVLFVSKIKAPPVDVSFMGQMRISLDPNKFSGIFKIFGLLVSCFGGIMSALWGSSLWSQMLAFFNSVNTGKTDPIFNHDLSFYLFKLPFFESLNAYIGFLLFFTIILVGAGYAVKGGFLFLGNRLSFVKHARIHITFLVFLFFVKLAFGFYLDRFEVLYSPHSVLTGAGYADINAKLIMLRALAPLTLIGGLVFSWAIFKDKLKVALFPVIGLVAVYMLGVVVYPGLLQNFKVAPNEQAMEEPFIRHHIALTKYGYNLQDVRMIPFDVSFNLTAKDIRKNDTTIKNIKLWDEKPLLKTYSQLQQIRTYYRFNGIDTDRYTIEGEYRQMMLSARELSYNDLPSKSWINEKFVFTHGNGIVMGPVSKISKEGLPEFTIKDIPPSSATGPKITTPEIYFGELTSDYVIVNTKVPEFSYPTSEGNIYTAYKGSGGVRLDSLWKRAVFSSYFQTAKIILSSEITPESRILYNRNVVQRVQKIAPFLILDSDPYVVVGDKGKIYWIVDCYTASTRLPYSKPLKNRINYMRNSVKVVIDAYDGKTDFYVSDPEDVIIKVYGAIFPGTFKPIKEMPGDIKKHIRYPRDFFGVQTSLYATFHMNDPKVFYNKEDLWEVPVHNEKAMDANYLIMKLPEEQKEEFVLLVPYTPAKRDNLAAWFAARCDEPNYGKLLVFTFPRDRLVFGPRQVDARIDQDSYISQQLTLWGQRGSQVIRGKLLIIPIEKSLLYIQPLYLAAEDKGGLPELRRVIVAYENDVVMEENLEQALAVLFGSRKVMPATGGAAPAAIVKKTSVQDLAKEAAQIFERAKVLQKQGDWAGYGEQLKKLEQTLKQMTGQ
jgi:uncharacterized membrane protein (UPF0182 family)